MRLRFSVMAVLRQVLIPALASMLLSSPVMSKEGDHTIILADPAAAAGRIDGISLKTARVIGVVSTSIATLPTFSAPSSLIETSTSVAGGQRSNTQRADPPAISPVLYTKTTLYGASAL